MNKKENMEEIIIDTIKENEDRCSEYLTITLDELDSVIED
jgi:hypothetical protein